MGFLNQATVNTLYTVLLGLGLLYAVFLLITGQIGGDGDLDLHGGEMDIDLGGDLHVDMDTSAGDSQHGISPISPLTIATFVTAFGACGLVASNLFAVADRNSIIWATLGGLFFSAAAYIGFTYLFIKPQGSSEVRVADLSGKQAEVITPIPQDGMGEIAFVAQGGRMTYSARSKSGEPVGRGELVHISRIVGGVAYVEKTIE